MKLRHLLAVLLVVLAGTAMAQDNEEPEPNQEGEAHDYTRPTLLFIFSEQEAPATEPETTFEYQTRNWNFRWMPLLTSIVANTDMGHAALMPIPNPFTLLGMSYPETATTYPDRGPQNRYRKKMVAFVDAANRADRERRQGD